jgi:multidrug efflux pump
MVFFGVTISVFLTLYLIPAIYALLARSTKSPEYVSRLLDRLKRDQGRVEETAPEG